MATVRKFHRKTNTESILFKVGDKITIGKIKSEWKGWVWCIKESGKRGWVPETYLIQKEEYAVIKEEYLYNELTLNVGDDVSVIKKESGFFFCRTKSGEEGWVPSDIFKERKPRKIKDETKFRKRRH